MPSPVTLELYDGELQTDDGGSFPIRKFELATRSEYFSTLFGGPGTKGKRLFLIPGISGEVLGVILCFIKARDVSGMTRSNVGDVLVAAHELRVAELKAGVARFLATRPLTFASSFPLLLAAVKVDRRDLAKMYFRFIEAHFSFVADNHALAMTQLPQSALEQFLSSGSLNVKDEAQVWKFVRIWIEADVDGRQHLLPTLMKHLAVLDVTEDLADRILESPLVVSNPHCEPLLSMKRANPTWTNLDVLKNLANLEPSRNGLGTRVKDAGDPLPLSYLRLAPGNRASPESSTCSRRTPPHVHFIALWVLVSESHINTVLFVTYDENVDLWREIVKITGGPQIVPVGRDVFILRDKDNPVRYSLEGDSVHPVQPFEGSRDEVVYVQLSGSLYAIGGYDADEAPVPEEGQQHADSHMATVDVLKYVQEEDRWQGMAPMLDQSVSDTLRVATVAGRMYVVGVSGQAEITAQVYSPDTDTWDRFPAPLAPRTTGYFALVEYGGRLVILGGGDGRRVESFDHQLQKWSEHKALPFAFFKPYAFVLNGELIVHETRVFSWNPDASPPLRWDERRESWRLFDRDSPMALIDDYQFIAPSDREVVAFLARENKDRARAFIKSPLAAAYDEEGNLS